MSLPRSLNLIVEDSLKALSDHPLHNLNLCYRQSIWTAFGESFASPWENRIEQFGSKDLGRKKRTILAILTARHVLPVWESLFEDDDTPHRLLFVCEQVLQGLYDKKLAQDYLIVIQSRWQTLFADTTIQDYRAGRAISAGNSALLALSTALYDEQFSLNSSCDRANDDLRIDPDRADSAYWAAIALAGPLWHSSSDANKRLQFWQWWLQDSVDRAARITE